MSTCENTIDILLTALAEVDRALAAKVIELTETGASPRDYEISIGRASLDELSNSTKTRLLDRGVKLGLHISAYLEAEIDGRALTWWAGIGRRHTGWNVERCLKVDEVPVVELAIIECADSDELARVLPRLIQELLSVSEASARE